MISLFPIALRSRLAASCRALLFASVAFSLHSTASAAWPPEAGITNGFGMQLKGNCDSPENLDAIKALGIKWVRRGFHWEGAEKEKGVYDFTKLDEFMNNAKARGFTVIGCIAFGNKLYGGHPKDEPARSGYAAYAAALASHYKDYDVVWEIWNEPNTKTFWGSHGKVGNSEPYAQEYYNLVSATVPAMKKANPKCVVLGGSVSNMWTESYKWMDFIFKKGVLKTGIDVWSVHPYGLKSPEDYIEAYGIMRKSMAANGGPATIPVINSERGFPLGKAEGFAGGKAAMAKEYQAWHLVRQYLIDALSGVKATIWYEWAGSPKEGFSIYQPGQPPTPAVNACKVLIEQLKGYKLDQRIDVKAPRDFVLRFTNATGGVKIIAWTAPPAGKDADQAVAHAIQIPVEGTSPLEVVDIYGAKSTATPKGGVLELNVSGSPQYVTVKK